MEISTRDVLKFWFGEGTRVQRAQPIARGPLPPEDQALVDSKVSARWFKKSDELDAEIRESFLKSYEGVVSGLFASWLESPEGRLAYIIVLDQFARNMFRGDPKSFSEDALALAAVQQGIELGQDRALRVQPRVFFYMPLMHSEVLAVQDQCVEVFRAFASELTGPARAAVQYNEEYAVEHRDIVARFGRFPHRNAVLGRESTPEEAEFLAQPGSGF